MAMAGEKKTNLDSLVNAKSREKFYTSVQRRWLKTHIEPIRSSESGWLNNPDIINQCTTIHDLVQNILIVQKALFRGGK